MGNTNIDGKRNIMFALTAIKGIGRRYANIVLKKANIDLTKRAGELSESEVEKIITIMQNPRQYKVPDWFLNRQKDIKDGKTSQVMSNFLDNKLREDLDFEDRYPDFGDADSPHEVWNEFYSFYSAYITTRSYSWMDQYDIRQAENRR